MANDLEEEERYDFIFAKNEGSTEWTMCGLEKFKTDPLLNKDVDGNSMKPFGAVFNKTYDEAKEIFDKAMEYVKNLEYIECNNKTIKSVKNYIKTTMDN